MSHDEVHADQVDQVPVQDHDPVRYGTAHMRLVVDAQAKAAAFAAMAGPDRSSEGPESGPIGTAFEQKMNETADRLDGDPIVMAHRQVALTYQLSQDAGEISRQYAEWMADADPLDAQALARGLGAEVALANSDPRSARPLLRFD